MVKMKREEYVEYLTNHVVQSTLKQTVSKETKIDRYLVHSGVGNKWLGILPFVLHFFIQKKHKNSF